jgi:flagellar protein FliJ
MQMKRSRRLAPVNELAEEAERESVLKLAGLQARLTEAERRGAELRRFLEEYQRLFHERASAGMPVAGMRDYQLFIARLNEAVRAQDSALVQLRRDCERARAQWLELAARKNALGKVIAKAQSEEHSLEERRMQKELDDQAQRRGGQR